jgi:hypothetical protein
MLQQDVEYTTAQKVAAYTLHSCRSVHQSVLQLIELMREKQTPKATRQYILSSRDFASFADQKRGDSVLPRHSKRQRITRSADMHQQP